MLKKKKIVYKMMPPGQMLPRHWTSVPNILYHLIVVNLDCMRNVSFLGYVEVRKIDVLRVGGSVAEPMCWVGRLRSL